MKIIHICTGGIFYAGYGYQENLLSKYHRLLGNEVTVIAPTYSKYNANGSMMEEPAGTSFLENGIKVVRLKPLIPSQKINKHMHLVIGLKKAILAEKPDIIFVHNFASLNYRCLYSIKKQLPNVRIAFDNHADENNSARTTISKFLHSKIYRLLLTRRLEGIADRFYGVTHGRCNFLHEIYGVEKEKIELLLMGADDEKLNSYNIPNARKRIRNTFGFNETDFLIVSGGKIDATKKINLIIDAVKVSDKNIKLLIFGSISPDLKEYMEASKSNKIKLAGWVDSDKVYEYFMAADLIVFTGRHSVLWEQAIASRIPCVFPKIKGFEHVEIGKNCILTNDFKIEDYKHLLNNIYNDKEKYRDMLNDASSANSEQFLYSNIATKVINDLMPKEQ